MSDKKYTFEDLKNVVKTLRSENGCPWDKVQTHESIKNDAVEEAYEVVQAIDDFTATKNPDNLREELGDLLFQVVFHSQIAKENGEFTLGDVIDQITAKMIHRHPHVFRNKTYQNSGEQKADWEALKKEEHGQSDDPYEQLSSIPAAFPSLTRAQKVAKKSYKLGLLEDKTDDLFDEAEKNLTLLRKVCDNSGEEEIEKQLGEVLFSLAKIASQTGVKAESSLSSTTKEFIEKWQKQGSVY